jgi:hypothetical protein
LYLQSYQFSHLNDYEVKHIYKCSHNINSGIIVFHNQFEIHMKNQFQVSYPLKSLLPLSYVYFYSTVKNIAQNIIAFKWRRLHRMSSTKRTDRKIVGKKV